MTDPRPHSEGNCEQYDYDEYSIIEVRDTATVYLEEGWWRVQKCKGHASAHPKEKLDYDRMPHDFSSPEWKKPFDQKDMVLCMLDNEKVRVASYSLYPAGGNRRRLIIDLEVQE